MSQYYCTNCAGVRGDLNPYPELVNLTGTTYQLDKFIKHTLPTGLMDKVHSVYGDPSYDSYKNNYVLSNLSGISEVDPNGRVSLLYYFSGTNLGPAYLGGVNISTTAAVKVVLNNTDKVHHFGIAVPSGTPFISGVCSTPGCGQNLLYF
jgi:hypothetical protein